MSRVNPDRYPHDAHTHTTFSSLSLAHLRHTFSLSFATSEKSTYEGAHTTPARPHPLPLAIHDPHASLLPVSSLRCTVLPVLPMLLWTARLFLRRNSYHLPVVEAVKMMMR